MVAPTGLVVVSFLTGRLIPRSASVTLDGTGQGYVSFEIDNTNTLWSIDSVRVRTNQAANTAPVPRADTYKNFLGAPQASEGGTFNGHFATSTGQTDLYVGDVLFVQWTGGIPGTVATATIFGDFTR